MPHGERSEFALRSRGQHQGLVDERPFLTSRSSRRGFVPEFGNRFASSVPRESSSRPRAPGAAPRRVID